MGKTKYYNKCEICGKFITLDEKVWLSAFNKPMRPVYTRGTTFTSIDNKGNVVATEYVISETHEHARTTIKTYIVCQKCAREVRDFINKKKNEHNQEVEK